MTIDTGDDGPRCDQAVIADGYGDGCCGPEAACGAPATWTHADTGLALCDEHEANARKYSFGGGSWRIGDRTVTYPGGWSRVTEPAEAASSVLEVVRLEG